MIKILVADSYCLSRAGLYSILSNQPDIEVICQSMDSNEAITDIRTYQPEVIVMDINIQPEGALHVVTEILRRKVGSRFLILANDALDENIISILRMGASGCILKQVDEPYLIQSIKDVSANKSPISPQIAYELLNFLRVQNDQLNFDSQNNNPLTQREFMVLKQLSEGLQNKIIGCNLDITERTVEAHVRNILKKLNATSRTHAVILANRNGWISNHN